MTSIAIVVGGLGCLIMVEEEGIVGMREDDVLTQEGRFHEGMG